MDFRVFSRNISENMHARCVREDTKQALKGNLQADGVQSRQTLFVRYCLTAVPSPVRSVLPHLPAGARHRECRREWYIPTPPELSPAAGARHASTRS